MARNVNGADFGTFTGRIADRIGSPRGMLYATYLQDKQRSVSLIEDFTEDTINVDYWTLTKDTNATDYAFNAASGGTIRGTAANSNGEGIGIYGPAIYLGDKNCGMDVRMKIDAVTGLQFEIGFADTATDFKDPIVSDIDTPTAGNGAGDFAAICLDTGETLTTAALVTLGSTPYTIKKSLLGTWSPTAATYFTGRVQLIGDNVFAAIFDANDFLVASTSIPALAAGAGGIEGGVLVRPYVNVTRVATADKVVDIDLIRIWQDR